MDILQLYNDYSIDYRTERHKHTHPGWVHTACPFCEGNPGLHLGYKFDGDFFVCWRCGGHHTVPTISRLIGERDYKKVEQIIKRYGLLLSRPLPIIERQSKIHQFPSGVMPMGENHRKYLLKRGFDPDKMEREWGILGTGPSSLLDGIDYKHRLMIPFHWDSQQVSFDSRDITGKSPNKYMACPKDRELIPHKEILYGKQEAWGKTGICVEGPTDVWRFGINSFATSGIKYTPKQVRVMARTFKKIWICYDSGESQALQQATNLRGDLRFHGVDAKLATWTGGANDPGDMTQEQANWFVDDLMKSK